MSRRNIISIPDPLLREVSKPVERIDDELHKLLDDMLETMYAAPGIGLAGIQIAVPLRIVTLDVAARAAREEGGDQAPVPEDATEETEAEKNPLFLINPEILVYSDELSVYEEGCLSIPDYYADVERPAACTVKFLDRSGTEQILEAEGLLSTCIQHEVDHLDGKLFIDRLSKLKRDMVVRKFTKIAKQNGVKPATAILA